MAIRGVEIFHSAWNDANDEHGFRLHPGWYWWSCQPGCLPDGDPNGPFATAFEAELDATKEDSQ